MRLGMTALLLAGIVSPAFAQTEAEVFSSKIKVTCKSPEHDLEIRMIPRAPRIGEKVQIYTQSEQTFVRGKVEVRVIELKAQKLITRFVANDGTDPWESSWPVASAEGFSFYAQDPGKPNALSFGGKEISKSSTCSFQ